jgi:hypothetical protein
VTARSDDSVYFGGGPTGMVGAGFSPAALPLPGAFPPGGAINFVSEDCAGLGAGAPLDCGAGIGASDDGGGASVVDVSSVPVG